MSRQKLPPSVDTTPSTSVPPSKRGVNKRTANKWLAEYDKELNTLVWLRYELGDRDHVLEYAPIARALINLLMDERSHCSVSNRV